MARTDVPAQALAKYATPAPAAGRSSPHTPHREAGLSRATG
jgi:hypothetical protein